LLTLWGYMSLASLPANIAFVSVAVATAMAYLLVMLAADAIQPLLRRFRRPRPASCRPGEVVHQALKISGRRWDRYCTAALLFAVAYLLLSLFGRRDGWADLHIGIYAIIAFVMAICIGVGTSQIVRLAHYRGGLSRLLDRHIEIAKRLSEAQVRGNHVYHSVPIGDSIIDNVVVGTNGVYTVQLFSPPRGHSDAVALQDGQLVFSPDARRCSLRDHRRATSALAKALSQHTGSRVTVIPELVIPDCPIEAGHGEELPLLVSMESCVAFIGWKDADAYLMSEDVSAIGTWLAGQALVSPPRTLRSVSRMLAGQIDRPALI
jgi:hypothetical protein